MADLTNSSWSEADSSNTQPSPAGFPSGILPSQVGGVVRALMGATKRSFDRSNVMTTSTGSANAYVLTYSQPPEGYVTGEIYRFFANFTNTAAPSLNINGLGTRPILRADGSVMAANEIVSNQVVSVVVSGNNFLHQPVGTRFFTDSVNISTTIDAVLSLEDTSAPNTSYRQKRIYSTKNANGGNDWLFRQVRPSDGATQDFTLSGSAPGTVWTTGNFNPTLKADLAGATFTGAIAAPAVTSNGPFIVNGNSNANGNLSVAGNLNLSGAGSNNFQGGNGDGATYATQNVRMHLHFGLGMETYDGTINGFYDARAGRWDTKAAPRVNGSDVWYPGNFDPNSKASLNSNVAFSNINLNAGGAISLIYNDSGQNNVVVRTGPANLLRYSYWNADGFYTSATGGRFNGDLYSTGRVIVGEGQNAAWIEMRDTDEGTRYLHNNSGLIGFLGSGGDWIFRVGDDGAVWTKQFGDLNSRIENRASDFAIARANERVAKTGDTMTGNLVVAKSYPEIQMVWGNIYRWSILVDSNAQMYFRNGDNGEVQFAIRPDGSVWSKQMGDINARIEQRASDFANDRLNTATARINNKSARLSYLGDISVGDVGTSVLWEGYGGGVITGFQQNGNTGYARLFRFRQLQMSDSNGNWYGCGYV